MNKLKSLYSSGELLEVIELSKEMQANPKYFQYRKLIFELSAWSKMKLELYEDALPDFDSLIKIDSASINYYQAAAFASWKTLDSAKTIEYLQKAFAIDPYNPMVLSNLSFHYTDQGYAMSGVNMATIGLKYVKDSTTKALLLSNRAYGFNKLGDYEAALIDIEKSIILYPENSFAYCYRAMANIGLVRFELVCNDLLKSKELGAETMTKSLILEYCEN
jgi:tetratricopeptide (TPR) repeat protein